MSYLRWFVGLLLIQVSILTYAASLEEAGDDQKAFEIYSALADQGDPDGMFNVGGMYAEGVGVNKDVSQGIGWVHKAAEAGHIQSQRGLGFAYKEGSEYIQKDTAASARWFLKAAEQGDEEAQYEIGKMYVYGDGVQGDLKEGVEWTVKACEQKHKSACHSLGYWYEQDYKDFPADYKKSLKFYRMGGYTRDVSRLKKEHGCSLTATTQLFRAYLKCTNREQMRLTLEKVDGLGVRVSDENKPWGDLYDSSSVLDGSTYLYMTYTASGKLASAKYTFPSHMDTEQVVRISSQTTAFIY